MSSIITKILKSKNNTVAMGKLIIIVGLALIGTGMILLYAPKFFSWFGNLPGDINFEKENSQFFIPITSMILISIVLTILVNLIGWFLTRWK